MYCGEIECYSYKAQCIEISGKKSSRDSKGCAKENEEAGEKDKKEIKRLHSMCEFHHGLA